ncbi:MAG: hypothetical protein K1X88_06620 [Nannocystaceae bacterium]|nr:hypothetical protein [Nannocystaceae bacterium]
MTSGEATGVPTRGDVPPESAARADARAAMGLPPPRTLEQLLADFEQRVDRVQAELRELRRVLESAAHAAS